MESLVRRLLIRMLIQTGTLKRAEEGNSISHCPVRITCLHASP